MFCRRTEQYSYGFNGKEKEDEISGNGNEYDFGSRIYDSRLGRFMSIDKEYKLYPEFSPYSYALNNPVRYKDEEGKGGNGGFSVENTSTKPVMLVGTTVIVAKKTSGFFSIFSSAVTVESQPTGFYLNPGERYETVTTKTTDKNGVETTAYTGVIKNIKTGKVVRSTSVGDVDFIRFDKTAKVDIGDGAVKNSTEIGIENADYFPVGKEYLSKGGGQVKVSPGGITGGMTTGTEAGKIVIAESKGNTTVKGEGGPSAEFSGPPVKGKDGTTNSGTNSGTGQETKVEGSGGKTIKEIEK